MFLSVGDIIDLVRIVRKLAVALNDSRGSTKEYSELIDELHTLSFSLSIIQENFALTSSNLAIASAVSRCRTLVDQTTVGVEKYSHRLEASRSGNSLGSWWWKIHWTLFMKTKINEFRTHLGKERSLIETNLLSTASANISRLTQAGSDQTVGIDNVDRGIRRLPPTLGPLDETELIWLVDLAGKKTAFPIELCTEWTTFEDILKLYFQSSHEQRCIERGDYNLTTQGEHESILMDPEAWEVKGVFSNGTIEIGYYNTERREHGIMFYRYIENVRERRLQGGRKTENMEKKGGREGRGGSSHLQRLEKSRSAKIFGSSSLSRNEEVRAHTQTTKVWRPRTMEIG